MTWVALAFLSGLIVGVLLSMMLVQDVLRLSLAVSPNPPANQHTERNARLRKP
jgi:uncharacterized protein YneF (UPF0154 family)